MKRAAVAAVCALASAVAAFGFLSFVMSIGTTVTFVNIDAYVFDRATKQPVPQCLLAFEKSETESGGHGQSATRTDSQGHSSHDTTYSHKPSLLLPCPFLRDRAPDLRFYVGDGTRVDPSEKVEGWNVLLFFKQPWIFRGEIAPRVEVRRVTPGAPLRAVFGYLRPGGDVLPADATDEFVRATLRETPKENGHEVYRVRLSVYLDKKEIAECQAVSFASPVAVSDSTF